MRKFVFFPIAILMAVACRPATQRSAAGARQVADQVLQNAVVIDTHADTPQMMLDEGYDLANPASPYMVSIPKIA